MRTRRTKFREEFRFICQHPGINCFRSFERRSLNPAFTCRWYYGNTVFSRWNIFDVDKTLCIGYQETSAQCSHNAWTACYVFGTQWITKCILSYFTTGCTVTTTCISQVNGELSTRNSAISKYWWPDLLLWIIRCAINWVIILENTNRNLCSRNRVGMHINSYSAIAA